MIFPRTVTGEPEGWTNHLSAFTAFGWIWGASPPLIANSQDQSRGQSKVSTVGNIFHPQGRHGKSGKVFQLLLMYENLLQNLAAPTCHPTSPWNDFIGQEPGDRPRSAAVVRWSWAAVI